MTDHVGGAGTATMRSEQSVAGESHLKKFWRSLDRADWTSLGAMFAFIVFLHVVGFGILFGLVVPEHFRIGGDNPIFTAGVGILAYTFGLRHAFDADHIAAIDNTTRKFMQEGQRPLSVGFFFALGHSTVVFVLALLFSVGVKALAGPVQDDGSTASLTGVVPVERV